MVRKSVLLPLLVTASVLVVVGFGLVVVPLAFEVPCPEPESEEGGFGSSPAPSPGEEEGVCLRVSYFAVVAVCGVVGFITGIACSHFYDWLADGEEEEAAGEAKKAGYVSIAGDLEVAATGGGGGNN